MNPPQPPSQDISIGHDNFIAEANAWNEGAIRTRRSTAGTTQQQQRHDSPRRLQRPARNHAGQGVKHGELPAGPAERRGRYLLQPGEGHVEHPGIPAVRGGRRLRRRADGRRRRHAAGAGPDDVQNPALGAGHGLDHRRYVPEGPDPHAVRHPAGHAQRGRCAAGTGVRLHRRAGTRVLRIHHRG